MGSFHDDNNVFHGFQCIAPCNTFSEYNAPGAGTGANQGTITFGNNLFGETVGFYVDANNVAHGFATEYPFRNFTSLNVPGAGKAPTRVPSRATSTPAERLPDTGSTLTM